MFELMTEIPEKCPSICLVVSDQAIDRLVTYHRATFQAGKTDDLPGGPLFLLKIGKYAFLDLDRETTGRLKRSLRSSLKR